MSAAASDWQGLPLPPGVYLSPEQGRRASCLLVAVNLIGSRGGVSWQSLMTVAEWLYSGARND